MNKLYEREFKCKRSNFGHTQITPHDDKRILGICLNIKR